MDLDETNPATSTDTYNFTLDLYCAPAAPTGLAGAPCCPPDPTLAAQLAQILGMVTLIQRQSVPFGYVPGAVHAGLSGTGSIAIAGILGAKMDITTLPASLGSSFTSPAEHFDVGFITWATPDGYPTSDRIEHQPTLSFPLRAGLYTELFYDLHPGVVVTITELLREP
jgi:hypothetical protein